MSATVIDLASRRPAPRTRETCRACRRGTDGGIVECYPHRLDSLARRLRVHLLAHDSELLTPTERVAAVMADALEVLDAITTECLPDERTAR